MLGFSVAGADSVCRTVADAEGLEEAAVAGLGEMLGGELDCGANDGVVDAVGCSVEGGREGMDVVGVDVGAFVGRVEGRLEISMVPYP
mmetsp:Transcript_13147/g.26672  ORF Transcript_13147/g.26672 Transcript_13147/m.26672 type:complete len:88 (+) Transcript_13147:687-950(+)